MSDQDANDTPDTEPESEGSRLARQAWINIDTLIDEKVEEATAPLIERIDALERRAAELEHKSESRSR